MNDGGAGGPVGFGFGVYFGPFDFEPLEPLPPRNHGFFGLSSSALDFHRFAPFFHGVPVPSTSENRSSCSQSSLSSGGSVPGDCGGAPSMIFAAWIASGFVEYKPC